MIIQCISDLHETDVALNPNADYIFLLGDIHGGFFWKIKDFLYDYPQKQKCFYTIMGNHDEECYMLNYPWVHWMNKEKTEILGNKCCVGFLPWEENPLNTCFDKLPDIVISHAPIYGVGGNRYDKTHIGSRCYREYIEACAPKIWIHGHLHKPYIEQLGMTQIVGVYRSHVLNLNFN